MLFKNFYNNHDQFRLNEGNFISSDWTGLIDQDAKFRLSELTIDKLFEGLDLEKSEAFHTFIKSNMPSLAPVMGKDRASITSAFELIRSQISYMDTRILFIEKDLSAGFQAVIDATKTSYAERKKKISEITNPSGVSSVIPKIDEAVKNFMKSTTIDFKSEALKQSFISLYNLDISSIIKQTLTNLEQSASTVGLKGLYTVVDGMELEEIEPDTAQSNPKLLVGSLLEPNELIKCVDLYDRLAGFYEMVTNMYPYGQQLSTKFGKNYISINLTSGVVGPDAIMAIKQFIPSIDSGVFEPMGELLNEVSSILLKRVFLQSPDEDTKNIFTPSMQVMYMCMVSLVSLKLINLNLEVESLVIKTEEYIKKQAELKKQAEKIKLRQKFISIADGLESLQFFNPSGVVYRVGSTRMSSQVIKLVNNLFVYMGYLENNKLDDTNYDQTTFDGVLQYQIENNLRLKDGKIGKETKASLTKYIVMVKDKLKKDLDTLNQSAVTGTTT